MAAAQWLKDAMSQGMVCSVVEGHKNLGRDGEFVDACIKTLLRLTRRQLLIQSPSIAVQLRELKAVERHRRRPGSPVFRTAKGDVFPRLVTLRWDQTGRATTAAQYVHLLFPTRTDATVFQRVMADVQRLGMASVLSGRHAQGDISEPTEWQIGRARERFAGAIGSSSLPKRLLRLLFPCVQAEAAPTAPTEAAEAPAAQPPGSDAHGLSLPESEEMHLRWAEAVVGRPPAALPAEELRPLVDAGMPLRYRHAVWSRWIGDRGLRSVEEMHSQSLPDVARQIDLDIPRTRPAWLQDDQAAVVRRVLNAYSVHNPAVGYCQGMNFLAMVFVLLGFSESTALAGLSYIVEEIAPGYHGQGLEGYIRDAAVLEILVHHNLPAVRLRLEALDVQIVVLALDHFVSLMAGKWPLGAIVRLWDFLFSEGCCGVFASFLALLELYFPMQGGPDCEALEAVDAFRSASMCGADREMDKIIASARRWLEVLPFSLVEKLRADLLADDEPVTP